MLVVNISVRPAKRIQSFFNIVIALVAIICVSLEVAGDLDPTKYRQIGQVEEISVVSPPDSKIGGELLKAAQLSARENRLVELPIETAELVGPPLDISQLSDGISNDASRQGFIPWWARESSTPKPIPNPILVPPNPIPVPPPIVVSSKPITILDTSPADYFDDPLKLDSDYYQSGDRTISEFQEIVPSRSSQIPSLKIVSAPVDRDVPVKTQSIYVNPTVNMLKTPVKTENGETLLARYRITIPIIIPKVVVPYKKPEPIKPAPSKVSLRRIDQKASKPIQYTTTEVKEVIEAVPVPQKVITDFIETTPDDPGNSRQQGRLLERKVQTFDGI